MSEREKIALKHGAIKLFLIPKEVALLVCCLDWVKLDLQMAVKDLERIRRSTQPLNIAKQQIPQEAFTNLIPLIDCTLRSILEHSISHYDEAGDSNGKAALKEAIDKFEKTTSTVQQYRDFIVMKTYRDATS